MNSASLRQMNADALARFQPFLHHALADDYRMLAMVKMSDVLQAKLEPSQRLAFDVVELARQQFDFVLVNPNDFSVVLAIDVTDPSHDAPSSLAAMGAAHSTPLTAQQLAAQQAYVQSMMFKASFCKQVNLPLLLLPFADVIKAVAQDVTASPAATSAPPAMAADDNPAPAFAPHSSLDEHAPRLTPALLRQKIDAAIAAAQDAQPQWPLQQRAQPYRSKQKTSVAAMKAQDGGAAGEAATRQSYHQSYAQKAALLRQRLAYGYSAGALQLTKQWLWSRQALALKGGLLLAVSILLISALRYNTEVPSAALAPTTAAALAPALAPQAAPTSVPTSAVIPGIALEGQGDSAANSVGASASNAVGTTANMAAPRDQSSPLGESSQSDDTTPASSVTVAQLSDNAKNSDNAKKSENAQQSEDATAAAQTAASNSATKGSTARASLSNAQDNTYWKIQPSQAPAVDPVITAQQVCAFRQSEYSGLSNKQNKRLMDRDCSFAKALAAERAQQKQSNATGNDERSRP